MEIIVEGWRAGREEREEAARVPPAELPPLTDGQKAVAKRMGISEEAYARSAYAGRRNQARLIEKVRRFAAILQSTLGSKIPGARIEKARLSTLEHEYRIEVSIEDKKVLFRVAEDMVDDYMERGFAEVGESIERNLETAIAAQATQAV
ncbi:MAG: hypothetical protein WA857_07280 [Candidatus Acidiferrum sp.]